MKVIPTLYFVYHIISLTSTQSQIHPVTDSQIHTFIYEPLISSAEEDALTTVSIASAIRLALFREGVQRFRGSERVCQGCTSVYIHRFIRVKRGRVSVLGRDLLFNGTIQRYYSTHRLASSNSSDLRMMMAACIAMYSRRSVSASVKFYLF